MPKKTENFPMPRAPSDADLPIPRWLAILASLAIVWHLGAVTIGVLAAPSGPWPSESGSNLSTPPQFAFTLSSALPADYLKLVKMANNYHFPTNHPGLPGVRFEVRLRDEAGREVAVLQFPDAGANSWVRHRQALLARWLAEDQAVFPPASEVIAAPNQAVPSVEIWDIVKPQHLRIRSVPQHLIPRDRPVMRPSELSVLMARSYARYLCRTHGAASAEIIRHTQEAMPPLVMWRDDVQFGASSELISTFGELPR